MQLDRAINPSGKGKFATIRLRDIPGNPTTPEELAAAILEHPESVVFGTDGTDEFFTIMLHDPYAATALYAYAGAAMPTDPEYALSIAMLAERSRTYPVVKWPEPLPSDKMV